MTTGSRKDRGNQYIQLVKVLYCKLLTDGKQLPAFPLEAVPGQSGNTLTSHLPSKHFKVWQMFDRKCLAKVKK